MIMKKVFCLLTAILLLAVGCSGTGDDLVSPEPVVPEPEVESGDPIAFSAELLRTI